MAIRRVTGAVSPSELVFADANALGATYSGSGTTIERGETFTLPAAGTTAVSNGALRLEALKGDCTITNNGNSTLTNASGVNGTIIMRSGASDFPAFVRNSNMGSLSVPVKESLKSTNEFPAGTVLQVVTNTSNDELAHAVGIVPYIFAPLTTAITLKKTNSRTVVTFNFGATCIRSGSTLGYMKTQFKIGSGSYEDVTPIGKNPVYGNSKHHLAQNYPDNNYQVDAGSTMTVTHIPPATAGSVVTYACVGWGEGTSSVWYVNRSERNGGAYDFSSLSTCTIYEIAT